ncbi:uncharacterized protein LOC123257092 [Drosophila ananassae]|uniref:uncharacterized protein LOC123257092 n=1 Tax=Drosophila ananassae TaxID=7217 RepID=UPI001CFFECF3|nr:uncharacterized protein LOC123257092 [Drosophila ananassae]
MYSQFTFSLSVLKSAYKMWTVLLLLGSLVASTFCHVTFTNLKCEMFDRKFGKFEKCYIRAVNRTHKYIDIYTKLYKLPIDNVTIELEPMHYNNGYKSFLLGMKVDACKYLSNPRHPSLFLLRELHATIENVSNMNHTCPFDHDIKVEKMWTGNLEKGFLKFLPIPNGDYAIFGKWFTYNIPRANVNVYFKIKNK